MILGALLLSHPTATAMQQGSAFTSTRCQQQQTPPSMAPSSRHITWLCAAAAPPILSHSPWPVAGCSPSLDWPPPSDLNSRHGRTGNLPTIRSTSSLNHSAVIFLPGCWLYTLHCSLQAGDAHDLAAHWLGLGVWHTSNTGWFWSARTGREGKAGNRRDQQDRWGWDASLACHRQRRHRPAAAGAQDCRCFQFLPPPPAQDAANRPTVALFSSR